ncbi:sulfite exporter TauE/SafE family protein [Marinobacter changyiensis]|uniref:sulfite exporter TauE/SafE family protein n=1 Tax=Marinobacter changyiensis TaxID=2604091 RepID=UPI00126420BD|nr:sulfite exporter TauE/SafE family protein [Marinobacter changyiensis]
MTLLLLTGLYLILGAFAGLLAGLFGIGGGLIIVPVLIVSFDWQNLAVGIAPHLAVGTSLATIIFTSISSIRSHHFRAAVRWDIFRPMVLGILAGAASGAWTASLLPGSALELIIGIFVILVAVKMLLNAEPGPGRSVPGSLGLAGVGAGIGWVSAIFGIGGGTLTVPFLSWCNVRMQHAIGTAAACGLPIAAAGAAANVVTGWQHPALPEFSVGFIYLPALLVIAVASVLFAPLGAALAHRIDALLLKRIFAMLLIVIGIRFLI